VHLNRLVRSAPFRLTVLYVAAFGVSVLLLGAIVYWITEGALVRQFRGRIEVEAKTLDEVYRSGGLAQLQAAIQEREKSAVWRDFRYLLVAKDGLRVTGAIDDLSNPHLGWSTHKTRPHSGQSGEQLTVLTSGIGSGDRLAVAGVPTLLNGVKHAMIETFGWVLAASLLIGLAGGAFVSSRFLDRIDSIGSTARTIIDGNFKERMPVIGTGDELDRLAQTLNVMLDRISELMESLSQVSNDIAHDLRTPLSRLRQRLEDARSTSYPEVQLRSIVDEAILDTDEILAMFAALLRISQIEAGTRKSGFAPVHLSEVVGDVVEAYAPAIEEEGKRLEMAIGPGIALVGDRELLTLLVANLMENAIRHTPKGIVILVALAAETAGVRLVVADNGPGVPSEARDQLLKRFYRLECSRTTPGCGLGLSLVKAISDLHGAGITLGDNAPGLRVEVLFANASCRRASAGE
jgi:signal transduction histidine kinase